MPLETDIQNLTAAITKLTELLEDGVVPNFAKSKQETSAGNLEKLPNSFFETTKTYVEMSKERKKPGPKPKPKSLASIDSVDSESVLPQAAPQAPSPAPAGADVKSLNDFIIKSISGDQPAKVEEVKDAIRQVFKSFGVTKTPFLRSDQVAPCHEAMKAAVGKTLGGDGSFV